MNNKKYILLVISFFLFYIHYFDAIKIYSMIMKESFLNRAKENFESAELLFNNGKYNASANRAYYAAFHICVSFLYDNGFEPIIDHRNVLSMFINEYINKKKIFPSSYKKLIYTLQDKRNLADYKTGVSADVASKQLKNGKEFVNCVIQELRK